MKTANPTLQETTLKIGKEEFSLYIDFAAMATAEALLKKQGVIVNMLHALNLSELDAGGLAAVLFAALQRNHPEVTYTKALSLLKFKTLSVVFDALLNAYLAAQKIEDEDTSPND